MGYGKDQIRELESTINKCPVEVVVAGTPVDLDKLIKLKGNRSIVRVRYEYKDAGKPGLEKILNDFLKKI